MIWLQFLNFDAWTDRTARQYNTVTLDEVCFKFDSGIGKTEQILIS